MKITRKPFNDRTELKYALIRLYKCVDEVNIRARKIRVRLSCRQFKDSAEELRFNSILGALQITDCGLKKALDDMIQGDLEDENQ